MRVRSQRGQTLVELLLGLAITSVILGALAGTLYTVTYRYGHWSDLVTNAGNGFSLAAALQADGHRYIPCQVAGDLTTLHFSASVPRSGTVAVIYASSASSDRQSFVVTRTVVGSTEGPVVADRLPRQPTFTVDSTTFAITVSGIAPEGAQEMVVYCRPPSGGACP